MSLNEDNRLKFVARLPAFTRSMAATSWGLNIGYALATNNMNMVGSCGDGYLMINLFWGYRLWNNGANNMLAYCYHTNSTACLCHGADHMLAFCRSISPPQKRRSISKMQMCYHMLRTCEPSYTGRIYSRLLWMLSTWCTLQFPFAVPRRIVEGLWTDRPSLLPIFSLSSPRGQIIAAVIRCGG